MSARLHVDASFVAGAMLVLPAGAARHVQVLRLQPGAVLRLFDGRGLECPAEIVSIGRSDVEVRLGAPVAVDRELSIAVTLAVGMPANERMDALVEKACELGAAAIEPLVCARSVLRLDGERAAKRRAHWQAVAIAAAEQCGRTRVPQVALPTPFAAWLAALDAEAGAGSTRVLLSLDTDATPLARCLDAAVPLARLRLLSGPEGGLAPDEEGAARRAGFEAASLGARVLRADTAPLAALAVVGAWTPR
ncbi:MAG TPA: 16S rRNA (uracil(1498)-N(3))-methyltransferase [Methylibium sp.]|uniref:16S rRNA (uracil(1498)-N(3))-methyltransferase n=1 Tax=Methylibium sp. TaxID=2067992 RepID=UPI002DBC0AEB|nr:16S rRNA (uracil(1498)-N(3))-methyltransferase [Methylibium sp.]HEU4460392.1 16S rRNA (uracil(1498)-N(3))-methyltransferase [Methylibium sp.]